MRWRGTSAELKARIREIPQILAGLESDPLGLADLFWGMLGNAALEMISADFAAKLAGGVGPYDGRKWAELAVATLAKRRREGRDDDDILYETGNLLASLQPGFDERPNTRAPDQIFAVRPGGVEVGSADEKVDFHEKGIPGRMPARPVMPPTITAAWEAELERAAERAVVRVIEKLCESGGG